MLMSRATCGAKAAHEKLAVLSGVYLRMHVTVCRRLQNTDEMSRGGFILQL